MLKLMPEEILCNLFHLILKYKMQISSLVEFERIYENKFNLFSSLSLAYFTENYMSIMKKF